MAAGRDQAAGREADKRKSRLWETKPQSGQYQGNKRRTVLFRASEAGAGFDLL